VDDAAMRAFWIAIDLAEVLILVMLAGQFVAYWK
jgi:hypothetical protein